MAQRYQLQYVHHLRHAHSPLLTLYMCRLDSESTGELVHLLLVSTDCLDCSIVANVSFGVVTESSLKHAAAEIDVTLSDNEIAALMSDYCCRLRSIV